jgi:Xylose isomerase-like TIM barrel
MAAVARRPAFGLNFDPSHFGWQDLDPVAFLGEFRDRIYHVDGKESRERLDGRNGRLGPHLPWGDPRRGWDFVSAGCGAGPWEDVFRMLNSIGLRRADLRGVGGRRDGPATGRAAGAGVTAPVRLRPARGGLRRRVQLRELTGPAAGEGEGEDARRACHNYRSEELKCF